MRTIVDARSLYLDLLKKCLTGLIYEDPRRMPVWGQRPDRVPSGLWRQALRTAGFAHPRERSELRPFDPGDREEGRDWPATAHTMIGLKRLDNLQFCVEDVIARGVPGDLIETGVWRGGACIFMRAVLKAHAETARRVWVADSFCGLPKGNAEKYPQDAGDPHHTWAELGVPLDEVQANFAKYDLLDAQVCFLPGWFRDTLPGAPIAQLAVIRLDGDMYESTLDALNALYPRLAPGGYLIVDDYGAIPACRQAVDDYRAAQGIGEEIRAIDWTSVYWQRR